MDKVRLSLNEETILRDHHRANVLWNLIVIVSVGAALLFRDIKWGSYLDPLYGVIFISVLTISFIKLIREILRGLADRAFAEGLQAKILRYLSSYTDLYDCFHGASFRRVGKKKIIEVTLGFNPHRKMGEFLDLSSRIKELIEADIPDSEVRIFARFVEEYDELVACRKFLAEIKIDPMSEEALEDAMALCKASFKRTNYDLIRMELEESFRPGLHAAELAKRGVARPRYWVAYGGDRFLGFFGFYFNPDEPDAVWASYWATDRSAGMSAMRAAFLLLKKLIYEAYNTGRRCVRLSTALIPEEAKVKQIHRNWGFKTFKTYVDEFGDTIVCQETDLAMFGYESMRSKEVKNSLRMVTKKGQGF